MANCMKEALYGAINVPLAVFWRKPDLEPACKDISEQAATNPAAWTEKLNTDERLWLVGKVDTTALYGEKVAILEQQGQWLKVVAVTQPTTIHPLGYPGWILAKQFCCDPTHLNGSKNLAEAVVSTPQAILFTDSALTHSQSLLSYQTRLPIVAENQSYFKVCLPDGTAGFLSRKESKKASELFFDSQNIIQEARQFLDLRYLWGGTCSWGFDCSGFMFRLYQSQGLSIPRDASEQAGAGIAIDRENLSPGDLLFFTKDLSPEKIHHVGMYIGEGKMIHSPNSKSAIRIEAFGEGIYGEEYFGARRFAL